MVETAANSLLRCGGPPPLCHTPPSIERHLYFHSNTINLYQKAARAPPHSMRFNGVCHRKKSNFRDPSASASHAARREENRDFEPYAEMCADPEVMRRHRWQSSLVRAPRPGATHGLLRLVTGNFAATAIGVMSKALTGRLLGSTGILNPVGWACA